MQFLCCCALVASCLLLLPSTRSPPPPPPRKYLGARGIRVLELLIGRISDANDVEEIERKALRGDSSTTASTKTPLPVSRARETLGQ